MLCFTAYNMIKVKLNKNKVEISVKQSYNLFQNFIIGVLDGLQRVCVNTIIDVKQTQFHREKSSTK